TAHAHIPAAGRGRAGIRLLEGEGGDEALRRGGAGGETEAAAFGAGEPPRGDVPSAWNRQPRRDGSRAGGGAALRLSRRRRAHHGRRIVGAGGGVSAERAAQAAAGRLVRSHG